MNRTYIKFIYDLNEASALRGLFVLGESNPSWNSYHGQHFMGNLFQYSTSLQHSLAYGQHYWVSSAAGNIIIILSVSLSFKFLIFRV